ncbi:MAG: helix-turn-helix domain-containing protein [Candidatus Jordarchaeaceae archaeon]
MSELSVKGDDVAKVAKALASETRFQLLKLLSEKGMDVSRIAAKLNQTEANISAQIKILEKVGLLKSHYEPGEHGVRKICETAVKKIIINLT